MHKRIGSILFTICILLFLGACDLAPFPQCVEADDFGYPKVAVAAETQKPVIFEGNYPGTDYFCDFPEGNPDLGIEGCEYQDKQEGKWIDTGYITTGDQFVISTDYKWTSWFNGDVPKHRHCDSVMVDGCPWVDPAMPGGDEITPCWFDKGFALYALVVPYERYRDIWGLSRYRIKNSRGGASYEPYNPNADKETAANPEAFIPGAKVVYLGKASDWSREDPYTNRWVGKTNANIPQGWLFMKIRDRYYDDNQGGFLVRLKSGVIDPVPGIVQMIVDIVYVPIQKATEAIYKGIVEDADFVQMIRACLILYVMFFFISYIFGIIQLSGAEVLVRLIKMSIIIQMISPGSWEFFTSHFFNLFTDGVREIMGIMATAGSDIPFNPDYPLDFLDRLLLMLFSEETWAKIGALLFMPGWSFVLGQIYVIIILLVEILFLVAVGRAMVVYVMSVLAISIIMILAPIFITTVLFKTTRELFEGWLRTLLGYSFQPILLFAFLGLFQAVIITGLYHVLGFRACWDIIFSIPPAGTEIMGNPITFFQFSFWKPDIEDITGLYFADAVYLSATDWLERSYGILEGDRPLVRITDIGFFAFVVFLMWQFMPLVTKLAQDMTDTYIAGVDLGNAAKQMMGKETFGDITAAFNKTKMGKAINKYSPRQQMKALGNKIGAKIDKYNYVGKAMDAKDEFFSSPSDVSGIGKTIDDQKARMKRMAMSSALGDKRMDQILGHAHLSPAYGDAHEDDIRQKAGIIGRKDAIGDNLAQQEKLAKQAVVSRQDREAAQRQAFVNVYEEAYRQKMVDNARISADYGKPSHATVEEHAKQLEQLRAMASEYGVSETEMVGARRRAAEANLMQSAQYHFRYNSIKITNEHKWKDRVKAYEDTKKMLEALKQEASKAGLSDAKIEGAIKDAALEELVIGTKEHQNGITDRNLAILRDEARDRGATDKEIKETEKMASKGSNKTFNAHYVADHQANAAGYRYTSADVKGWQANAKRADLGDLVRGTHGLQEDYSDTMNPEALSQINAKLKVNQQELVRRSEKVKEQIRDLRRRVQEAKAKKKDLHGLQNELDMWVGEAMAAGIDLHGI